MMNNRLTPFMVSCINKELALQGSNLVYTPVFTEDGITCYQIQITDKFINYKFGSCSLPLNEEFTKFVRDYFKTNFDVTDTGYKIGRAHV